ncbi:hypothetical protein MKW94_006694 [Papaver nudicaule]|uniref:FLZ-type domain-containing protein n=1 Tax=Papaver nudicaule TaxID=74823 RepID=A0AA42B1C9_PAPNU|nr:hypothetical protein [Papaver nudicaule]
MDSAMETKSLPKDYGSASNFIGSENEFGTSRIQLETKTLGRNRSWLSDSDKIMFSKNFSLDEARSGLPLIIGGAADSNNFVGMKPSSLPMSFGSMNGIIGDILASEIELSEDYTCVTSHGPNPKTTHIFCDCFLECHTGEMANSNPPKDFLSFCYLCEKEGKDIYMYRGDKAFCSSNCPSREILFEEKMEKAGKDNSTENSIGLTYKM